MSQPPPPNQPPGPPGPPGDPQKPGAPGFGPPTPPPAPGTPPTAPPLPPAGQPGQPGYGYPQQQPPGGAGGQQPYGYPQQPPPPPGQPGPGQPPTGSGFGAPTPPGPYGPGPGTPPPGGAWGGPPGQPGMPGGPPRPGGGNSKAVRLAVIIAAVVVLLVAGGSVVLVLSDDGDDKKNTAEETGGGQNGGQGGENADQGGGGETGGGGGGLPGEPIEATLAWHTPKPEVTPEQIILDARGSWIAGDNLVRTLDNAIRAYNLETGEEAWSLPLELSGGDCNASPTVSENRVAVLQGRDCEVMSIIDITTGQEVNSFPLNLRSNFISDTSFPAFLGDTVAVGWGIGGAGYDATTGEQLWEQKAEDNCPEISYAVIDEMLVSHRSCGWLGDEGGSIRATNEAGEELWEWEFDAKYEGKTFEFQSVLSVDPLIVTAWLDKDIYQETLFVVDDKYQKISHTIDFDANHYESPCRINSSLNDCRMGVLHEGYLYLSSTGDGGNNAIAVFDVSSGDGLFEVPATPASDAEVNGAASQHIRPIGVEDGKILAYQRATYDDGSVGKVVAIDPATEEATPVMNLDPAAATQEANTGSPFDDHELKLLWHEHSLIMISETFQEGDHDRRDANLVYR